MTDATLGLKDSDYWDEPTDQSRQIDERLHEEEGFRGICLGGPAFVSLEDRSTIPVLVYQNDSVHALWRHRDTELGVVVAVDAGANLTYARQAVEPDPEAEPVRNSEPPDDPDSTSSSLTLVELRERLRLPWVRADYLVHAIVRDQRSNRIEIRVGSGSGRYHDEAVERYLDELRRKAGPRAVRPPVGELPIPHYGKMDSSPEIPGSPGISMTLPRVLLLQGGSGHGAWLLEGSFRLPAQPRDIVPAGEGKLRSYPSRATAVVGISVVLVGADDPGPWVLSLGVPSFDPVEPGAARPIVTGHFAVDLLDLPECPTIAQTYFAYAFASDVMTGPVPSALVSDAMLPPDVLGAR